MQVITNNKVLTYNQISKPTNYQTTCINIGANMPNNQSLAIKKVTINTSSYSMFLETRTLGYFVDFPVPKRFQKFKLKLL